MILSGKSVATEIEEKLKAEIAKIEGRAPHLTAVLVGDVPASEVYVRTKRKACERIGMKTTVFTLPATIPEKELLSKIAMLNQDENVDGILVQMPLPSHINSTSIFEAISPAKDVDGFHPINMGKLLLGEKDGFVPCTPLGIVTLLERYNIPLKGKNITIIGRSNIVGKPLSHAAFLSKGYRCDSYTLPQLNYRYGKPHKEGRYCDCSNRQSEISYR